MPTVTDPEEDEQLSNEGSSNENYGPSEDDLSRKNTTDNEGQDNAGNNSQSTPPNQQKDKKKGSSLKDKVQKARRLQKTIKRFGNRGGEKEAGKRVSRQAGQLASKAAKQLAKQAGKQAVGLLREPHVAAIVIGIFLLILFIVIIVVFIMNAAKAAQENEGDAPQLTIQKIGPTAAKAGDILTYTISATYPGTYSELTLVDTIPVGTQFVAVQAGQKATYNAATRTVTWKASENTATAQTVGFTLQLRATVDNAWIVNVVNGTAVGSGVGTGAAPDLNQGTFKGLITGQGRNTTILGDENAFVATVIKNKPSLKAKEAQVRQVYKAALAKNVSPLIILTIWGVESGWSTGTGNSFGCVLSGDKSWAGQLNCVVNTANKRMAEFDTSAAKKKPVLLPINPQPPQCTYTDPFMYAFERMTPVCAVNDGNACARVNFVSYFKTFLGTPTNLVCNQSTQNTKDWRGIDP